MERINSERLAILGSLHWACLQALSNEVPTPLEGLSQGARFLKLDSSTARKMRDLDVALALTRHLTSRKAEATLQQLSAAIKHSGSMRRFLLLRQLFGPRTLQGRMVIQLHR